MNAPLVSILIPCHNAAPVLAAALHYVDRSHLSMMRHGWRLLLTCLPS